MSESIKVSVSLTLESVSRAREDAAIVLSSVHMTAQTLKVRRDRVACQCSLDLVADTGRTLTRRFRPISTHSEDKRY